MLGFQGHRRTLHCSGLACWQRMFLIPPVRYFRRVNFSAKLGKLNFVTAIRNTEWIAKDLMNLWVLSHLNFLNHYSAAKNETILWIYEITAMQTYTAKPTRETTSVKTAWGQVQARRLEVAILSPRKHTRFPHMNHSFLHWSKWRLLCFILLDIHHHLCSPCKNI